ncbi:hypothetical protein [Synechococcus phage Yong-M3-232]|nr:hypothetical protein [Synechococcus phage Yong-M3-232]
MSNDAAKVARRWPWSEMRRLTEEKLSVLTAAMNRRKHLETRDD